MQKLFSYTFSQNIWRILPDSDPNSDLWVIELRDSEKKEVSIAVIDLKIPELIWHSSLDSVDWWTSLTAFSHGRIFLHNYRHQDIPEPTDLLMISADDGKLQWFLPNHLLVKTLDELTIEVAFRTGDGFKYLYSDAMTGVVSPKQDPYGQKDEKIILQEPIRYKSGDKYFDRLANFITENTNGHLPASIDYLEKRPVMMFSYYIYELNEASEYLLVVNNKQERIHHEQLAEGRTGIGKSTMFLAGSKLVYLKNNNEFSSLTLS